MAPPRRVRRVATVDRQLRPTVGALLREWRVRRRLSQLDLAGMAGVSTRHLSFIETGRSRPSREMVLHLADELQVPLRDRTSLLLAAGPSPSYGSADFSSEAMRPVRDALEHVLRAHEPYPALVVNRLWELVAANAGVAPLLAGVAPDLLEPPVNVLRVALHPDGLAPRIANFEEWSGHLLSRLGREVTATRDPRPASLYEELRALPGVSERDVAVPHGDGASRLMVTLRLKSPAGDL